MKNVWWSFLCMNKNFQMLNNTEGAIPTDHMHWILLLLWKKSRTKTALQLNQRKYTSSLFCYWNFYVILPSIICNFLKVFFQLKISMLYHFLIVFYLYTFIEICKNFTFHIWSFGNICDQGASIKGTRIQKKTIILLINMVRIIRHI